MIRPLLFLERLSFLEPEGKVGNHWDWDAAELEINLQKLAHLIFLV